MPTIVNGVNREEASLPNGAESSLWIHGNGIPGGARAWWKEASVYQIYPASFYDSDGDGLGDIPGIIAKMDYFKKLGVDVIWLSPVYESPQKDMGYDIADYTRIHKPYGTVQDVEDLIKGLHNRGIRLIMDLVVNHTSDQHKWFQESRTSKANPFRDWYIWRPPKYDAQGNRHPPNNWASIFGGSAWKYDPKTDEYYLHLFCTEQPDLNWENPKVVSAVHNIMTFWLDKGVDGFRMDVINMISKTPGLPDAPVTVESSPHQPAMLHYANGPRLHEHLRGLREILDRYNAFSVGEMPSVREPEEIIKVVGASRKELNMIFQFDIVDIDSGSLGKFSPASWSLSTLKDIVGKWQTFMIERDGWNALFLENHDQPRSVSRFASDSPEFRIHAAKMLATFLAFQSGTLFIYQGQELGMANLPKDWKLDEFKDVETINYVNELAEISKIKGQSFYNQSLEEVRSKARDNSRSPIQWDTTKNAGFSTGVPWMRVNDDYMNCNAQSQINDPESVFAFWQNTLKLRRKLVDVFVYGDFKFLNDNDQNIYAYERSHPTAGRAVVLCNFSSGKVAWKVPSELLHLLSPENLILHNYSAPQHIRFESLEMQFAPFESMVFFVSA
ncbi:hypothetical protein TWF225_007106 [Orbilia oligospora]|nr:hypothetical protein TWF225_007106 [Orbilia oligospora]KAF3270071.1 hypothetical protein TWF217_008411 [Orbilia oligospora]KAF3270544.1 hypothetical protein TWF128_004300 [Orbilia oligospora]KAF3276485.1 hypothetical protein TWF132_002191 [Orbilia oligospora]